MKKSFLLALLIMLLNSSFMIALDIQKLDPLKENETLCLEYDKSRLDIIKNSAEGHEVYFTCKSSWGAWQISSDKKKVLIYENGMRDLYLLDGNKGTIRYKGRFENTAFPSGDFKYLITSQLVVEDRMRNLFVYDFENMKELYNFPWISQREHFLKEGSFDFRFYRALEPAFDFVIYSVGEAGEAFAYSMLNAETKDFCEVIFKSPEKIPKHSNYENGWE